MFDRINVACKVRRLYNSIKTNTECVNYLTRFRLLSISVGLYWCVSKQIVCNYCDLLGKSGGLNYEQDNA